MGLSPEAAFAMTGPDGCPVVFAVMNDIEWRDDNYLTGAAVAFGLLGMAEAIQRRAAHHPPGWAMQPCVIDGCSLMHAGLYALCPEHLHTVAKIPRVGDVRRSPQDKEK
jgi:hypothetical protein